jgi:hypothetical protein
MLRLRRANERGGFNHGWLETRHSFSFGAYQDPAHMGFRALRVINEDVVQPGEGFGTHGHRDMEIITVVNHGRLHHRDSLGNEAALSPDEVQRISAGTGVRHSEFNGSESEPVRFHQIWILPDGNGRAPRYEDHSFPRAERMNRLCVVASGDGRDGSLPIHRDAAVLLGAFHAPQAIEYPLAAGRHAWVQVMDGSVLVNGLALTIGDGLAVSDEESLRLETSGPAEVIVFDLD